MKRILLIMLISLPAVTYADFNRTGIYKSVDAEGNTVYSDTPTIGAEKLTPPPISTIDRGPDLKVDQPDPKDESIKPPIRYSSFSIQQPKNDNVIWDNQGTIPVSIKLEPELDVQNGHSVWVYIDGKAVVKQSTSLAPPISGIERGTHNVRAEIRDAAGNVLKRTNSINVHIKKHVAPTPSPR